MDLIIYFVVKNLSINLVKIVVLQVFYSSKSLQVDDVSAKILLISISPTWLV